MKTSAIVPTHNSEAMIGECLDSLLKQKHAFDEIIVVDDASTDGTVSIARERNVKVLKLKERKERSHARNLGWKRAKGDILAFIESDAVFSENWLAAVLESFEQGADAVIDTRRVHRPETFIARMNDDALRIRFGKGYAPFSAWTFRREVLEDVSGFDERLFCAEDADLGKRILAKGYKIVHQPKAVQYHEGEPRSLGEEFKRRYWFGAHILSFYQKNPEKLPKISFLISALLTLLVLQPRIFLAYAALLYLAHLFRILRLGMKMTYAVAFPLVAILGNWVFFFSFVLAVFKNHVKPRS